MDCARVPFMHTAQNDHLFFVKKSSLVWKALVAGGFAVVLLAAAQRLPLIAWLQSLQGWFSGLGFVGILLFAVTYAIGAIAFVPCSPWTISAGIFFGFTRGMLAVLLGSTLGASIGFFLARAFGRERIAEKLRHNPKFSIIDRAIGKEGWKIVILLRMMPIPFGLSNYIYGLTAVTFSHYLIATWLGMLYGNLAFVYLGAIGGRSLENSPHGHRHPLEYVLLVLSIIAAFAVGIILRRIAKKALAEAEEKELDAD